MKLKTMIHMALSACLLVSAGCELDTSRITEAGMDIVAAATVSDVQLKQDAKEMRTLGDSEMKVAPAKSEYVKRLEKLIGNLKNENGLNLNFKVYLTDDINANATPDGSIRVYSGLMDLMNDEELFFVIGHEVGHVANGDSLDAMRMAYVASGVRKGASSASPGAAALSNSVLGDLLETVVNNQFSQDQESSADEYGYKMMLKYGKNPEAAVSALNKLAGLGSGGGFLSSHPDSYDRAEDIQEMIDQGVK